MCVSQKKVIFLISSSFPFYTLVLELPTSVESLRLLGTMTMTDGAMPTNYNISNSVCKSPSHLLSFHLPVKKLQKVFLNFQLSFLSTACPKSDPSIRDIYEEDKYD